MKLKPGVKIHGIQPEIIIALMAAQKVYDRHGIEMVVTSCKDGKHMKNSFHAIGLAVDLRTRDMKDRAQVEQIAKEIRAALGPDFDVVVESDHLHIESDEKT